MRTKHKPISGELLDTARLLKTMRDYLDITQKDAAAKIGIPLSTYQKFETGERNLRTASFTITCKVLYALELNPGDFYEGNYEYREAPKVIKECPVVIKQKGQKENG